MAKADGEEFGRARVRVTTLGHQFVVGAEGACLVRDFPSQGERALLVWQQAAQNFVIARGSPPSGSNVAGSAAGYLENPGSNSFQSGIGVISGFVCEANRVDIRINGRSYRAAYGTPRPDTRGLCGDTNNGFGLVFNWNWLGDGIHTVVARANGVEFGRARVRVTTLGEDFVEGASGVCRVNDFPSEGESVSLRWQESLQNFVIRSKR